MDQKIADIVSKMQFERRKPVPRAKKAAFEAMQTQIKEVLLELGRLHLGLWHAKSQRDYHSLSLIKTRERIAQLAQRLDALSRLGDEE